MNILAIDPGIGGTGWAVFDKGSERFISHGVLNQNRKEDEWDKRGKLILQDLVHIEYGFRTLKTYIEFPSLFQSAHGQMVARKGDLVKLAWFTGLLCGRLKNTIIVPVNEWKGQLPKAIVNTRILKLLGKNACKNLKSHDWDATGIGLWALGRF